MKRAIAQLESMLPVKQRPGGELTNAIRNKCIVCSTFDKNLRARTANMLRCHERSQRSQRSWALGGTRRTAGPNRLGSLGKLSEFQVYALCAFFGGSKSGFGVPRKITEITKKLGVGRDPGGPLSRTRSDRWGSYRNSKSMRSVRSLVAANPGR